MHVPNTTAPLHRTPPPTLCVCVLEHLLIMGGSMYRQKHIMCAGPRTLVLFFHRERLQDPTGVIKLGSKAFYHRAPNLFHFLWLKDLSRMASRVSEPVECSTLNVQVLVHSAAAILNILISQGAPRVMQFIQRFGSQGPDSWSYFFTNTSDTAFLQYFWIFFGGKMRLRC